VLECETPGSCVPGGDRAAALRASPGSLLAAEWRLVVLGGRLVILVGLLCVLYPKDVFDLAGRIDGALTAYACGDALGLPWESPPDASARATLGQIEQLPAREGWPRGATSDDTALTLLVARHLADRDGDGDPAAFLADLAGQEPAIRGLGPTTTAAIERFHRGDEAADPPGKSHERGGDARSAHRLGTSPRPGRTTPAGDDRDVPGHPC
jgi:ADP-ribosylglycohydrolase